MRRLWLLCLEHPGVRDKRRVCEINWSHTRQEAAFLVTSQWASDVTINQPNWVTNYPSELIGIYVHTNTDNKESLTQRCRRSKSVQLCLIFLYSGLSLNGCHALFCITKNCHDVTITTHTIMRHFLIWMTTVRQPTKQRYSCILTLNYTYIYVYWWTTRQKIHNTLIVVDRYLRIMGGKTIPDPAEPRLESFYPPFVAGIDLPHLG